MTLFLILFDDHLERPDLTSITTPALLLQCWRVKLRNVLISTSILRTVF